MTSAGLVWDYRDGVVIDPETGIVVDRIYYYGPQKEDEREEERREIKLRHQRRPLRNRVEEAVKRRNRLLRDAERIAKKKPWLVVDYERLLGTGKLVNTLKSTATLEAEERISLLGVWDEVEKGLEIVRAVDPSVLSRTGRGKYALGYMVYMIVYTKSYPGTRRIRKMFNISGTTCRRLRRIAYRVAELWERRSGA